MPLKLGSAATLVFLMGALVDVALAAAQSVPVRQEAVGTSGTVPRDSALRDSAQPALDASKLGVDIARVRRGLVRVTVREERDGLKLRYAVDVFGTAPPIDLFPSARIDPNYFTGPAPYGAPTHREFLNLNTPIQHRNTPADFGALFRWLADKSKGDDSPRKR
jgi:hypothetical protein